MRLFSICLSLCDLSQHNALRGLSLLSQMTGFPFSLSLFWPYHMAGRILVLQPGIEPGPRSESAEPEALDHQRIPTDALFLRLNNTPWHITCVCVCVWVCVCVIHSSAGEHRLSLCVVKHVAVSTRVQTSSQGDDLLSVGQIPRSGTAGSQSGLLLIFWGASVMFSIATAPTYSPHRLCSRVPSPHILSNACDFLQLCSRPCNKCEVTSHHGFDFHFPAD